MIQYGIWSLRAGGFIDAGFWGETGQHRAATELENHFASDPEASVKRICDEHEDEPYDGCQECLDELEEDDGDVLIAGVLYGPDGWEAEPLGGEWPRGRRRGAGDRAGAAGRAVRIRREGKMGTREMLGFVLSIVRPRLHGLGGVISGYHDEVTVVGVLHDRTGCHRWQPFTEAAFPVGSGESLTPPTSSAPAVWLCRTIQLGVDTWSAIPPADATCDSRRLSWHVRRWEASGVYAAPGSDAARLRLARVVGFEGAVVMRDRDGLGSREG